MLRHLKLTSRISLVLLSLLSGGLFAQTDDLTSLNELKTLVDQKQFNDAFELSSRLLEEWGGEPGFDLLAGRAAYGAGYFQEAVFSFERVLIVNPDVMTARLYLAFSYFQVRNLGAAQIELTKLLKEELKPEDREKVEEYLRQITELKEAAVVDHNFNIRLSYAYDSNANSGTTLDNLSGVPIDSPIAPIIVNLDPASLEQNDTFTDVNLNYAYSQKLSQKSSIALSASYFNTRYDEQTQLDREILSLTGVYTDEWFGTQVNIIGFAQPMVLNGEFFRAAYGLSVDSTFTLSDNWSWLWGVSYTSVNLNANDNQDLDQYALRTRFTYQGDSIHIFDLSIGDDKNKEDNVIAVSNARDFWLLSYSYVLPVNADWIIIANGSYQEIEFDGANPLIGIVRDEESLSALLSVDYLFNPEWKVTGALGYTDKDSNTALYAYDRSTATLSITRIF